MMKSPPFFSGGLLLDGDTMEKVKNPFPYSDNNRRFHTWDYYLKKRFGGKVFKLSLDGGFSCPNLDGTRGTGGCSYCQYSISSRRPEDLLVQMERQKVMLEKKWPHAVGYIPYFQANTNTYAPLPVLRKKYETALSFEKAVGLSIATRADAISENTYDYLEEISKRTYLTVELGLQTIHDETAKRINRGHSFEEFHQAVRELNRRGIPICVHIINGLPYETREMMLETAKVLASLPSIPSKFIFSMW